MSKKLLNIRIEENDLNEFTHFCEENQVSKTEFLLNAIYKAIGKEDVKTSITSIDLEALREELLSEVDDRIKKQLMIAIAKRRSQSHSNMNPYPLIIQN